MKHRIDISHGIKVGAHHIPIKYGEAVTERLKEGSFYGRCYNTEKQILIDGTLLENKFNEAVIHEIIETVNNVYYDSKVPHRSICGLANGLTQAFDSLGITFKKENKKKS